MLHMNRAIDSDSEDEHNQHQTAALAALLVLGADESCRLRSARWHHHYLTWLELLPNAQFITPWRHLHQTQSNHAYVTTMGIDITTFQYIC
ncbi:hypothetical protein QCA50_016737 [Cerrena zonata]|uniref:Uncharacterized protein n=1 Tax=Cerrena zonata TaxID=2478898 RepID=A0AAW0FEU6_9APHY